MTPPRIAIVVPCYNEQEALADTDRELGAVLDAMISDGLADPSSYILYVDDGSTDDTWRILASITTSPTRSAIRLTANTGHQHCVIAGMEAVAGHCDAVVTIDADLQDDVRAIPEMAARYREGHDIVYGVRANRDSDTRFKRNSARLFYATLNSLGVNSISNHADFRLLSAAALDDLLQYSERNLYLRGIVPMLGYDPATVEYVRRPRVAGRTKYPLKKMINFALDGITSFSVKPVRMVFVVGLIFLMIALVMLIYVLIRYFTGETIEGWTSLILSVWFCSGVILVSLGIVGEYIGKIYTEVKRRPRYAIRTTLNPRNLR